MTGYAPARRERGEFELRRAPYNKSEAAMGQKSKPAHRRAS